MTTKKFTVSVLLNLPDNPIYQELIDAINENIAGTKKINKRNKRAVGWRTGVWIPKKFSKKVLKRLDQAHQRFRMPLGLLLEVTVDLDTGQKTGRIIENIPSEEI